MPKGKMVLNVPKHLSGTPAVWIQLGNQIWPWKCAEIMWWNDTWKIYGVSRKSGAEGTFSWLTQPYPIVQNWPILTIRSHCRSWFLVVQVLIYKDLLLLEWIIPWDCKNSFALFLALKFLLSILSKYLNAGRD